MADEARLGQGFVNLLINAAQAIPPDAGNHEVAIRARAEGDRIVVDVHDPGPGIAPDHLRRIFEPFFTTRRSARAPGSASRCATGS